MATVEDQQPEGQPAPKRQKGGKTNWLPAFSYEQTLDAPCKFHSGAKPTNHTTRKCHWLTRIAKGDGLLPPPPPDRRLLSPSSRRPDQSAQYKTSSQMSTEPMWYSPVWQTIDAAGASSSKR